MEDKENCSKQSNQPQNDKEKEVENVINTRLEKFYEEYHLSDFQKFAVSKFIRENIGDKDNQKVSRIRNWLFSRLNGKKVPVQDELQKGCPEIIPGLRAYPWWDTKEFEWISKLEENYEVIRDELLSLRNQKGFQPYRGPSWISNIKAKDGVGSVSTDSGDWNVFYLFLHDMKFDENCKKCPKTVEIIEKYVPRQYHHTFFSAVSPNTHIMKHNGPTNKKLRIHLPLVGIEGSRLRVGKETRYQEAGKCYVFDDSFEHEAWHDGSSTRIILICDMWHPDLSNEEVKFLNLIQKAKMKFEKNISEHDPEKDNFYSIIDMSRDILKSNDWWTVNEKEFAEMKKKSPKELEEATKKAEEESQTN